MKFTTSIILIALLSFAACLYLPWWMIAVAAFVVCVSVSQRPFVSFLAGFIALFLLWGGMAILISINNQHVLAHKVSMIIIRSDNPYLLILLTALVGGVVAGLGAISGSLFRRVFSEQQL
jgi:hypothetical protein